MTNEVWRWSDGESKIHCNNKKERDQILRIDGCKPGGVYYMPSGPNEYDVIVPTGKLRAVKKALAKTG